MLNQTGPRFCYCFGATRALEPNMLAHLITGRYASPRADEPYTTSLHRNWLVRLIARFARH